MNPIAVRLLNQQLIVPQFSTPAEVVRYMGAMQAQEYRMMRWAVAMRTRKPSYKAFKKAFDEGQIIRLHLMRGTWQLVCADDYWSFYSHGQFTNSQKNDKSEFYDNISILSIQLNGFTRHSSFP